MAGSRSERVDQRHGKDTIGHDEIPIISVGHSCAIPMEIAAGRVQIIMRAEIISCCRSILVTRAATPPCLLNVTPYNRTTFAVATPNSSSEHTMATADALSMERLGPDISPVPKVVAFR
jgi:hypothetical protein